jgi:hypothetical protein
MNPNETNEYIENFFDEKEIEVQDFELYDKGGMWNLVPTEVIIEFIKGLPFKAKQKVALTILQIDLVNGRVEDFLKYIAQAMIDQ